MRRSPSSAALVIAVAIAACGRSKSEANLPSPTSSAPSVPGLDALRAAAPGSSAPSPAGREGTGTLLPREQAELAPKVSGVITEMKVEEGDDVKKGQLLFRLDSADASLKISQAQSALESAKLSLGAAELDHKRTKELYDAGAIGRAAYDTAKTRFDTTKTAVQQAEVAVAQSMKGAGDTAVYSPLNGVVTSRRRSVGESVSTVPPTIVLVVQDVSVLQVRARLPERALATIGPGSAVEVTMPAVGVTRRVVIKRVNPAVDPRTRTVEIVADIDNADRSLRPGMLAEVSFEVPAGSASATSVKP